MYFARIALDENRRETQRALSERHLLHGAVEAALPGLRGARASHPLWRVDTLNGISYLLLVSAAQPRLNHIAAQYGAPGQGGEWTPYAPFLDRLREGQSWHFRLCANPTASVHAADPSQRGKRRACSTVHEQEKWLTRQAQAHGFEPIAFQVVGDAWHQFSPAGRAAPITLRAVTYEGALTITDAALFRKALLEGVGRGKAYGCGLLTIAPR
ncbi:MAG: type I-E CRISPR-associated protein Cas6/Cse3/CasE [Oscillospiraceae bacterium]|jgi:CRISPR system Cascade subunit CasE|nr:type I-E CRISPR-associated protein Cas6/Cse3/CasE [Oscillospiraceae bacterium]